MGSNVFRSSKSTQLGQSIRAGSVAHIVLRECMTGICRPFVALSDAKGPVQTENEMPRCARHDTIGDFAAALSRHRRPDLAERPACDHPLSPLPSCQSDLAEPRSQHFVPAKNAPHRTSRKERPAKNAGPTAGPSAGQAAPHAVHGACEAVGRPWRHELTGWCKIWATEPVSKCEVAGW